MYKGRSEHNPRPKLFDDSENIRIHGSGEQACSQDGAEDGNGTGGEDGEQAADT